MRVYDEEADALAAQLKTWSETQQEPVKRAAYRVALVLSAIAHNPPNRALNQILAEDLRKLETAIGRAGARAAGGLSH
jgi:hypothetical protein